MHRGVAPAAAPAQPVGGAPPLGAAYFRGACHVSGDGTPFSTYLGRRCVPRGFLLPLPWL